MSIQDKLNRANVIYKITKDIDLGGETLTIPEGCTLDFQGGSFSNGTIVFKNTILKGVIKIYCNYGGTIANDEIQCKWFGFLNDNSTDETYKLQYILDSFKSKPINFNNYTIVTSSQIVIQSANIKNLNIYNISEDTTSAAVYVYDSTQPVTYFVPYVNIDGLTISSKNNIAYGMNLRRVRYSKFRNITITNVQTCIISMGIFISSFRDITFTNYTKAGFNLGSSSAGSTSVTIEDFYSVKGKGDAIKCFNLDYSRFIKIACDGHNGRYFHFDRCNSVQIDTVGCETSTFYQCITCEESYVSFRNLCFIIMSIMGSTEVYFLRCNNARVYMETVYIEPLQNNLEGIVYPRGFYSQNGGRIVLVNASGDGIITGADAKTMVNSGVKLLDAIA